VLEEKLLLSGETVLRYGILFPCALQICLRFMLVDTHNLLFVLCIQIIKAITDVPLLHYYLLQDVPILWRRSCITLTSGAWSLFCPSMFFVTRVDGAIEVWDFLMQSNKPVLVQSISGSTLTGV